MSPTSPMSFATAADDARASIAANRAGPLRPREVSDQDLAELLEGSAEPVVVESYHGAFEVPWRGLTGDGWRALLRELGERVNGVTIETGANRGFAVRHGLEIIPAVLVFLGGRVVARFSGRTEVEGVAAAVRRALREAQDLESAAHELEAAQRFPARPVARPFAQPELESPLAQAS